MNKGDVSVPVTVPCLGLGINTARSSLQNVQGHRATPDHARTLILTLNLTLTLSLNPNHHNHVSGVTLLAQLSKMTLNVLQ